MKELSIEEKKLLFKDLSARLSYGVYIEHITTKIRGKLKGIVFDHIYNDTDSIQDINAWVMFFGDEYVDATYFRPILRSISSMTEEEEKEYAEIVVKSQDCSLENNESATTIVNDWYLSKGFDVSGLIPRGLAIEASEGMYKTK
jgi:hypothetical protein